MTHTQIFHHTPISTLSNQHQFLLQSITNCFLSIKRKWNQNTTNTALTKCLLWRSFSSFSRWAAVCERNVRPLRCRWVSYNMNTWKTKQSDKLKKIHTKSNKSHTKTETPFMYSKTVRSHPKPILIISFHYSTWSVPLYFPHNLCFLLQPLEQ